MAQLGDRGSFAYTVAADRGVVHPAPAPGLEGRLRAQRHDADEPLAAAPDKPPGRDPAPQRQGPLRLRRPVGAAARDAAGPLSCRPPRGRGGAPRLAAGPHRRRRHARAPPRAPTATRPRPAAPTSSPSISTPATSRPAAPRRRWAAPARGSGQRRSPHPPWGGIFMIRRRSSFPGHRRLRLSPRRGRAASGPRGRFVDKQVQAGGLLDPELHQRLRHGSTASLPAKIHGQEGRGPRGSDAHLAVEPLDRQADGPGRRAGTYTYTLRNSGTAYTLTMHLCAASTPSTGPCRPGSRRSGTPPRSRTCSCCSGTSRPTPRRTANLSRHGQVTAATLATIYVWPTNPWDGRDHGRRRHPRLLQLHGRRRLRRAQGDDHHRVEHTLHPPAPGPADHDAGEPTGSYRHAAGRAPPWPRVGRVATR